jgi:hypothetical protein
MGRRLGEWFDVVLTIEKKICYSFQGDQGYCYIHYAYMTDAKYCFDPWTVRQLETDDMGHEHWDEEDSIDYVEDEDDGEANGDSDIEEVYEEEEDEDEYQEEQ